MQKNTYLVYTLMPMHRAHCARPSGAVDDAVPPSPRRSGGTGGIVLLEDVCVCMGVCLLNAIEVLDFYLAYPVCIEMSELHCCRQSTLLTDKVWPVRSVARKAKLDPFSLR